MSAPKAIVVPRVITVCPRFDRGYDVYLGNILDAGVCVYTTDLAWRAKDVAKRLAWSTRSQIGTMPESP